MGRGYRPKGHGSPLVELLKTIGAFLFVVGVVVGVIAFAVTQVRTW